MMTTVHVQAGMARVRALLEPLRREIESHLEMEKQRIFDEILHYPPPIPACDVQFNFLLIERAKITQELRQAHEIFAKDMSDFDCIQSIREFVDSCKYFDASLEAKFLSELEKVLDE